MTIADTGTPEPTGCDRPEGFGLYVHVPFCERKCPYCDFNTYAGMQDRFADTVTALTAEMARWREPLADRTVTSVFIGGGTPTVLAPQQLEQVFAAIRHCFALADDCEITCEANPGTVDRSKFTLLRTLGVNRLSMGVQSFQPDELRFLGRIHGVEDVYAAFAAARQAGFDNINLDFIFGLPDQGLPAWDDTLTQALRLEPEHLSLYSLIVEPDTPLERWVMDGKVAEPNEDLAADLYEQAIHRMAAAGYEHYEVSNWARRTSQPFTRTPPFACRHNLLYWRNDDYLGIGPGAHSHLRRLEADGTGVERRWGNRKPVGGYIKRVQAGAALEEFVEEIDPRLAMGETMMLGLRLVEEGVCSTRFLRRHGHLPEDVFAAELATLTARGLVALHGRQVRLTPAGLLLGNQVFAEFLPN